MLLGVDFVLEQMKTDTFYQQLAKAGQNKSPLPESGCLDRKDTRNILEESPWKAVVPLRFDNSFLPDSMGCLSDLPISPEALISQGQLQQVSITPTKTTEDNECHRCLLVVQSSLAKRQELLVKTAI